MASPAGGLEGVQCYVKAYERKEFGNTFWVAFRREKGALPTESLEGLIEGISKLTLFKGCAIMYSPRSLANNRQVTRIYYFPNSGSLEEEKRSGAEIGGGEILSEGKIEEVVSDYLRENGISEMGLAKFEELEEAELKAGYRQYTEDKMLEILAAERETRAVESLNLNKHS